MDSSHLTSWGHSLLVDKIVRLQLKISPPSQASHTQTKAELIILAKGGVSCSYQMHEAQLAKKLHSV